MAHLQEYMLVTANTAESFTSQINDKISQGWELIGNLAPILMRDDRLGNTNIRFVQALGKFINKEQ